MTNKAAKRRRVNSLSSVDAASAEVARIAAVTGDARNLTDNAGSAWTEDVTDAAVWTIVGTGEY
jgi:hypothetical protein